MALQPLNERLTQEWHLTKNGALLPTDVSAGMNQKAWWLGKDCGHEWYTTISSRTKGGGCTVCSGRTILLGFNDLPSTHPHLIEEWHPTKNGELKPTQFTAGSHTKVWWLGLDNNCKHEWEATVANRSLGRGCPYCSGKMLLKGFNDLESIKPLVAAQWHPTKNLPLTLDQINVGSNIKASWIAKDCGHEWEMKVALRNEHILCSICDGYIVLAGFNDVATIHPAITADWHPTKNGDLLPTQVSAGSGQKVWFLGHDCGHEWETNVRGYIKNKNCIICSGKQVLVGFNDLASIKPNIAKEWHPTKNGDLLPSQVTLGSGKKVWWHCNQNHEWELSIGSRVNGGYCCPFCSGRNVIVGLNDLAIVNPVVAKQWHPTKNDALLPNQVKSGSNKKVWWRCLKGHEWDAIVNGRNRGQGCPTCAANTFISKDEQKIADLLISHGLTINQSDRRTVRGHELDIYVPSKKLAIEYNGLYWHCDLKQKDTKYHYKKWLAAKNAGIQLIQIWEDEWLENKQQIEVMLLHKLGITQQEKIFGRKTTVLHITKHIAERFFNTHHIQGYASASSYLGLIQKDTNELVAVLALKKEAKNTLNIIRYATSKNVVGGFTKLLKHAELTYKPERFITFSDHCVSDGGLYENNGFTADKELKPDYRYLVKRKRQHKFGYRLNRFKNDSNLQYEEGLTERELAILNGIPRVWDAGKTRWVKHV